MGYQISFHRTHNPTPPMTFYMIIYEHTLQVMNSIFTTWLDSSSGSCRAIPNRHTTHQRRCFIRSLRPHHHPEPITFLRRPSLRRHPKPPLRSYSSHSPQHNQYVYLLRSLVNKANTFGHNWWELTKDVKTWKK
jgi:hypothetical protein